MDNHKYYINDTFIFKSFKFRNDFFPINPEGWHDFHYPLFYPFSKMIFHYMAVNPTALFRFSYFGSIFPSRRFTFSISLREPKYQKPNAPRNATNDDFETFFRFSLFFYFFLLYRWLKEKSFFHDPPQLPGKLRDF